MPTKMAKFKDNISIVVWCILLAICQCHGESTVGMRCHFMDPECQVLMYQDLLKQTADGVPGLNIPKVDPMHMNNVVASLANSFKLTMIDGIVTGLKHCVLDNLKIHHEEPYRISLNMTCKVEVNAIDKVEVPKQLMEELEGENIADDIFSLTFKAKLILDKYHLYLELPFDFEWKNGEIHAQIHPIDIKHDAHDLALAKFTIEDLDEGSKMNGQIIASYIHEKVVELNLMLPITKKFGEFFQVAVEGLQKSPAKHFFKDDLSNFVKSTKRD